MGFTASASPFNLVIKMIILLPKTDHVTWFKNSLRVFYHLSFNHLCKFPLWFSLATLLPCSLQGRRVASSTGFVSCHIFLPSWGLTPPHSYNLVLNITAAERTMFSCYLQSSLSFFFKAHFTAIIH